MNPHKMQFEKTLLQHFCALTADDRIDIFRSVSLDYSHFLNAVEVHWELEKKLPSEEQLTRRLKQVRAQVRAPRLGKHGRVFTLRHYPEAKRLREEQGASYVEIARYLMEFRKFKISPSYLKRLMEALQ